MFVGFELELLHQQRSRHPAQSCWVAGTEIQGLFQVTPHYRTRQLWLDLVCTLQRLQANLLCCGRWEVVIAIWIKLVDAKLGSCGQKNWSLRLEKGKLWGCKICYYVVAQAMRILAHLKGGSIEWRTRALECAHLCPCGASFEAVKVQWVSTCVDNEHLCMEVCTQQERYRDRTSARYARVQSQTHGRTCTAVWRRCSCRVSFVKTTMK